MSDLHYVSKILERLWQRSCRIISLRTTSIILTSLPSALLTASSQRWRGSAMTFCSQWTTGSPCFWCCWTCRLHSVQLTTLASCQCCSRGMKLMALLPGREGGGLWLYFVYWGPAALKGMFFTISVWEGWGGVGCGAVRCGAVRCGAVRCGAVRCGGVVWCGVVWCGVVWCGVVCVWCGVVWCGVVWVVVWCGGLVWSGLVWSGLVWSGLVWSGLVWSALVSSGLVWYGMVG